MIEKYFLNSRELPLVVEPKENRGRRFLFEMVRSERSFLDENLLAHGAVLLRGFQVENTPDFRSFVRHFAQKELFNYAGGASPRRSLGANIYNSTEYPPDLALELHNELSYAPDYPRRLYFFCETEPTQGGATTLGDSRRILAKIPSPIVELFRAKQVLYERNLSAEKGFGYSWQEAFETDDPRQAEEVCRRMNADYEWAGENLRVRQTRPAIATHAETGEEVWFNQAHGFHPSALDAATLAAIRAARLKPRLNCFFGDGSAIDPSMLAEIRRVLRAETVPHRWRRGDILIVDNILAAHGRMPFAGDRKIILAMT